MLGKQLKRDRKNTCKYGCCTEKDSWRKRKTKHERARENREWQHEVND